MTISDNGVSRSSTAPSPAEFDERPLGQRIMRERAAQIGGILQVTGAPTGTTVWARVPAVPFKSDEQNGRSAG
jgi:signal transduction histidine kinase